MSEKYLDCHFMKHSIHFFYDQIRACCTNVSGPVFYPDYNGTKIDFNYIYEQRKQYIEEINNSTSNVSFPKCCEKCCEKDIHLSEKPVDNFDNIIDRVYFHNMMSCNAKCTYCVYRNIEKGQKYKVLPIIKELIGKNILSQNALVYMSGGEITISPEFDELFDTLTNYLKSKITILTSGIKYSKAIENAFTQNKCELVISIDSSSPEVYKKIKNVDCFEKIISNIKNYVKASENAKNNITMKYIIVDGINDNNQEISRFAHLVKELGVNNIRLDFDYEKYNFSDDKRIPDYYFELYENFNKTAFSLGLKIEKVQQIESIIDKSKK